MPKPRASEPARQPGAKSAAKPAKRNVSQPTAVAPVTTTAATAPASTTAKFYDGPTQTTIKGVKVQTKKGLHGHDEKVVEVTIPQPNQVKKVKKTTKRKGSIFGLVTLLPLIVLASLFSTVLCPPPAAEPNSFSKYAFRSLGLHKKQHHDGTTLHEKLCYPSNEYYKHVLEPYVYPAIADVKAKIHASPVYTQHIEPNYVIAKDRVTEVWNGPVKPVVDRVSRGAHKLYGQYIAPHVPWAKAKFIEGTAPIRYHASKHYNTHLAHHVKTGKAHACTGWQKLKEHFHFASNHPYTKHATKHAGNAYGYGRKYTQQAFSYSKPHAEYAYKQSHHHFRNTVIPWTKHAIVTLIDTLASAYRITRAHLNHFYNEHLAEHVGPYVEKAEVAIGPYKKIIDEKVYVPYIAPIVAAIAPHATAAPKTFWQLISDKVPAAGNIAESRGSTLTDKQLKAKAMKDAQKQREQVTDAAKNAKKSVESAAYAAKKSAESVASEASKNAKASISSASKQARAATDNVKANVKTAASVADSYASEATKQAKASVSSAHKQARSAADKVQRDVKSAADDAGSYVSSATENAKASASSIDREARRATDKVKADAAAAHKNAKASVSSASKNVKASVSSASKAAGNAASAASENLAASAASVQEQVERATANVKASAVSASVEAERSASSASLKAKASASSASIKARASSVSVAADVEDATRQAKASVSSVSADAEPTFGAATTNVKENLKKTAGYVAEGVAAAGAAEAIKHKVKKAAKDAQAATETLKEHASASSESLSLSASSASAASEASAESLRERASESAQSIAEDIKASSASESLASSASSASKEAASEASRSASKASTESLKSRASASTESLKEKASASAESIADNLKAKATKGTAQVKAGRGAEPVQKVFVEEEVVEEVVEDAKPPSGQAQAKVKVANSQAGQAKVKVANGQAGQAKVKVANGNAQAKVADSNGLDHAQIQKDISSLQKKVDFAGKDAEGAIQSELVRAYERFISEVIPERQAIGAQSLEREITRMFNGLDRLYTNSKTLTREQVAESVRMSDEKVQKVLQTVRYGVASQQEKVGDPAKPAVEAGKKELGKLEGEVEALGRQMSASKDVSAKDWAAYKALKKDLENWQSKLSTEASSKKLKEVQQRAKTKIAEVQTEFDDMFGGWREQRDTIRKTALDRIAAREEVAKQNKKKGSKA